MVVLNVNHYRNFNEENRMKHPTKNFTDDLIRHKLYYSGLLDKPTHTVSIDERYNRDIVYFSNGQMVQK